MNEQTKDEVRNTVREQYGSIARSTTGASCCAPGSCGPGASASLALGYSAEELAAVPEGANMGLGCGNPQAIAALKSGETVLDLGAGGGFDCFLAAKQVGPSGRVSTYDGNEHPCLRGHKVRRRAPARRHAGLRSRPRRRRPPR